MTACTWNAKDIVERLDEWSGGIPNGAHKDILVAAADKIDELTMTVNRLEIERSLIDWIRLKPQTK